MISFEAKGDFNLLDRFLLKMSSGGAYRKLSHFGQLGVYALVANTPRDTGISASSWSYKVEQSKGSVSIAWTNDHIIAGAPLVILLQYGHGTGTGGYVQGRDFINPALSAIFDQIAEDVWREVVSA